ncbi:hypothetical protein EOVG_00414 [Emiliania huxleyi virus 88]|nr:hypothetical protein EOVG_00414 [Emiliania huxleyi virus 88]
MVSVMLTMPNLSIDTTITRSESIDSTSSSSSSQFPKSMVSQMLTSPQLDIANDFYIAPKSPSMSDSPAVPQMDDWDDDELMAAMNSPPSSPMRSPSPVIDDEDDDETQAIWASNTQPSQDPASDDEIDEPPSPVADEPPSPVADEPPSPVTDTPLSIATTLAELTTDLSTAETCSQIIKVAMKLISSTRAHSKTLSSAVKKQATASTTRVDGAPRQRAPKGSRPPTAAGIYNSEKRALATEEYINGRRAVKPPKTDNKASHIQNILAEMWRDETPDTKAEYKAIAASRAVVVN